jgi:hypothetical protein
LSPVQSHSSDMSVVESSQRSGVRFMQHAIGAFQLAKPLGSPRFDYRAPHWYSHQGNDTSIQIASDVEVREPGLPVVRSESMFCISDG